MGKNPRFRVPSGEDLRRLRLEKGLTQAQLAKSIGVSQSFIARVEKGTVDPSLSKVRAILEVLDEGTPSTLMQAAIDAATPSVIRAKLGTTVREAIDVMSANGISQVPVLDDHGQVVGAVTEKKLVAVISQDGAPAVDLPLSAVMGPPLATVEAHASLADVQKLLEASPAVIVLREGKIAGIITQSDLLRVLRDVEGEA
ncbi:MAG: CBS domain-containing protein [Promethearchaeota archaeon]